MTLKTVVNERCNKFLQDNNSYSPIGYFRGKKRLIQTSWSKVAIT